MRRRTSRSTSAPPGLRDDIGALRRAIEKQAVVLSDDTDADAVAFAQDELEAAVFVFHVRGGRVRGQRGYVVDRLEGESLPELVESFVSQAYLVDGYEVPREVLVPAAPADADVVAELLTLQRGSQGRGAGAAARRQARLAGDGSAQRAAGLHPAQAAPGQRPVGALPGAVGVAGIARPGRRAACGSSASTSRACRAPTWWRRWSSSRTASRASPSTAASPSAAPAGQAADDGTVAGRRRRLDSRGGAAPVRPLSRGNRGRPGGSGRARGVADAEGVVQAPRKFAYPPNLVVVDGGFPQVNAGAAALEDLGIDDVAICGLAKRLEEVWVPGDPDPIILPRTQRRPLPAAARARRGPPVRDHLSPAEAVQVDGREHPRRRARARGDPAQGVAGAVRFAETAARGDGRGDHRGLRVSARVRPRPSSPRWPPSRPNPPSIPTTGEVLSA